MDRLGDPLPALKVTRMLKLASAVHDVAQVQHEDARSLRDLRSGLVPLLLGQPRLTQNGAASSSRAAHRVGSVRFSGERGAVGKRAAAHSRPGFNRMNVYPKAWFLIAVDREEKVLRLTLTRDTPRGNTIRCAPRRSVALCRGVPAALHRGPQQHAPRHFPSRLLTTAPLRTQGFGLEETLAQEVEVYLAGDSMGLVVRLMEVSSQVQMRTPFEQNLMQGDLICVEEFFECGPGKVRWLRQQADLECSWLEPEMLLDFLAANHEHGRAG